MTTVLDLSVTRITIGDDPIITGALEDLSGIHVEKQNLEPPQYVPLMAIHRSDREH